MKRKSKSIIKTICLLGLFSTMLLSCGGSTSNKDKVETTEEAKQVAVGNWIAKCIGWCIYEVKEDGTYTYAWALPADGKWGEKAEGTWSIIEERDQITGEKYFCIKCSNNETIQLLGNDKGHMNYATSDFGGLLIKEGDNNPW